MYRAVLGDKKKKLRDGFFSWREGRTAIEPRIDEPVDVWHEG